MKAMFGAPATQLVCASKIYRAHATTAQYAGSVFSFLAGGQLADRFGRKRASIAGLIVMAVSSTLLIWLPNIFVFIVIRLIIGLGFGLFYNVIFVYALEFVGPSKRTVFGITINHFWAVGIMFQSLLAYYVRAWRILQLIMSLPFMVVLLYWCLSDCYTGSWFSIRPLFYSYAQRKLPNSGRWLFTKGYIDQGKKVVSNMALINKVKIDVYDLSVDVDDDESSGSGWMAIELINHRAQAVVSLVVWYNWFVVSLLYYGLSLNIGNLGGDIILNFALSSLMEFLGYSICIPGMYKYGRKKFHCACMIIGGGVLLLVIFPELFGNNTTMWVKILFSMIGKLASSAAFAIAYLYSAELFPTILRGTALGISAAFATLGAFTAPYIVEMANLLSGSIAKIIPLIVFGVTAVTAGLLALSLPETSNAKLPDTIKDMKMQKQFNPKSGNAQRV